MTPVGLGKDGLPAGPGVARAPSGWIVQLRAPLDAGPGTVLTLRTPDGQEVRRTVTARSAPGPRTAASSTSPLTVLVPAAGGRWIVLTTR